jgi:predicted dehydrogenase
MAEKLTVAILGAGQIAGGYDLEKTDNDGVYSHAGAYAKDGRFRLQTVADLDPAKGEAFLQAWQACSATTCLEDVFNGYHDVISVCTPDQTHFSIIAEIIRNRSCQTIFAEKPLALSLAEVGEAERLARDAGINIVVNFQRRFDPALGGIRQVLATEGRRLRAATAFYIKGLEHIGTTMIDTLTFLCGIPRRVLAFNKVYNRVTAEFTYEFILFYDGFNVAVKSIDTEPSVYCYHIFEIDLLLADCRITINDNSRQIVTRMLTNYAYKGVKVLDDRKPDHAETGYAQAMLGAVDYIHQITVGNIPHTINTPKASALNKAIVDAIILSHDRGTTVEIGDNPWRK